ncbi:MAG: Holliday junction branch migration protein RuvA [Nakamurella sp.]
MIASVRGTVAAVALDHVVIEVGGVGLSVRATPATLATLRRGDEASLATTLVVREDSLTLFGFASVEAKELFELVQSVSGVGPRIALALLSVLEPDELRRALASGDTAALARTPGIGKKSAERLVLELRDKAGALAGRSSASGVPALPPVGDRLIDALAGLGFTSRQASDAVAAVTADVSDSAVADGDVGVLLRRALALLGQRR